MVATCFTKVVEYPSLLVALVLGEGKRGTTPVLQTIQAAKQGPAGHFERFREIPDAFWFPRRFRRFAFFLGCCGRLPSMP